METKIEEDDPKKEKRKLKITEKNQSNVYKTFKKKQISFHPCS